MERNLKNLLQTIEYKFPNAVKYASAVLPQKSGFDAKIVRYNTEVCSPAYKKYNVKFFNFGQEFTNPSLFVDDVHLNQNGTVKLTKLLQDAMFNENEQFLFDKVTSQPSRSIKSQSDDELPVHTERREYPKNNFF